MKEKLCGSWWMAVLIILALPFTGCAAKKTAPEQSCVKYLFAMDTFMTFTAYGENAEEAVDAAIQEVQRLDAMLSTGNEKSVVAAINQEGSGEITADMEQLLKYADSVYTSTNGLFDITIYPMMQLWGFTTQEYHVPSAAELEETMARIGADRLVKEEKQLVLSEGQAIDFGGIAKGYASTRVMEIYEQHGVSSGQVTLGGNVQVLNRKADGSLWRIGIQDPQGNQGELLAVVSAEDTAVITSGGYERYFVEDGQTYIHILDPRTGYPADSGLSSVTILSANGALADALSTALFIMGLDEAMDYWREYSDAFEMILVTANQELYVTEGIAQNIETSGTYQIITRSEN